MEKKSPRILILDDDPNVLRTLGDVLQIKGFELCLAQSGTAALSQICQQPVAVALIDLRLEDVPGLDVLRRIKVESPDTECIMLTGHSSQNSAIDAINLGAYSYFVKPFDMESLLVSIQRALERRETKLALAESEARYHKFINAATDMIFLKDAELCYLMVNQANSRFFNRPVSEIIGKDDFALMAPQAAAICRATDRQVLDKNAPLTFHEQVGDRIYETRKFPIELKNGQVGVGGYISDITESKRAEEALQREQVLMQALMDTIPDSIYFKDLQSRVIRTSRSQARKFGAADPSQVIGKTDFDFFTAEHAQRAFDDEQEIIRTGQPLVGIEEIETFADRPSEWVSTTKMALRDQNGEIVGTFGISRNITRSKLAETALKESENQYRKLVEESHELIFTHDLEFNILSMNPALQNIIQAPNDTISSFNIYEIAPAETQEELSAYRHAITSKGIVSGRLSFKTSDNGEHILEYQSTLIARPDGAPFVRCMAQDISAKIHHEQELEAIAALSGVLRSLSPAEPVIPVVLTELGKLADLDGSAISLLDEELNDAIIQVGAGAWESWTGVHLEREQEAFTQIRETRSLWIDEKAAARQVSDWPGPLGDIQTVVGIPLIANNLFIGVLWSGRNGKFSRESLRILSTLSDLCANAIRNAALYQQLEDRAVTLASLYEAGLAVNSVLEPRAQLEFLSKIIMDEFHADRMAFLRYLPGESCYVVEHYLGFEPESQTAIEQTRYPANAARFAADWVRVNELPLIRTQSPGEADLSLGDLAVRTVLWAPVKHGENMRGILGVMSTRPQAFTPSQERLLVLFTNQAAVALENASLLSETHQQIQRLKSLRKIDETINASLDINITTSILLDQTMSQLKVDAADILLFNPFSKTLKYINGRGFKTAALQYTELRLGQGLAGRAVSEQKYVHVDKLSEHSEYFANSPLMKEEHFYEYFGVPLISKGSVKGLLEIFHRSPLKVDEPWLDFMATLASQAAFAIDNIQMFENLQHSNNDLIMAYDATIEGWSRALDLRDKETEGHTQRVTEITVQLAKAVGIQGEELGHIRRGAILHDIGKMGIPDDILLKPGGLTEQEWAIMRRHPDYAFELISPITFLKPALDIPYCHHEKWDGSGYPRGLKGEQIPLSARLFAIADVWDALISDRPYRKAWPENQAIEYIRTQTGKHFDPHAVDIFFEKFLSNDTPYSKPTILIVDDEEKVISSLARSLKDQFNVITATSGQDALSIVEQSDPAVILTDQRMPGMSGVELLERVRATKPQTIGILISGYSDIGALTAAINLTNVRGFIPKPWDLDILRQKLEEAVAQYRRVSHGPVDSNDER